MLEILSTGKHTMVPSVVKHATCANGGKLAMSDKGGNVRYVPNVRTRATCATR